MLRRKAKIITIIIFLLLLAKWGAYHYNNKSFTNNVGNVTETQSPKLNLGGDFALMGSDDNVHDSKNYRGKLLLIYFGYTYCPDICPTELTKISNVMSQLKDNNEEVKAFFITIDPKRDNMEHLKEYIKNFPNIIALTDAEDKLKPVIDKFKVYASFLDQDDKENYLIDHSSFTYLIDQNGDVVSHYTINDTEEHILNSLKKHLVAKAD